MGLVEWCIRLSYLYARLTGVLNFKIDGRTGRPYITTGVTIYAAVINLFTCSIVPLQTIRGQFSDMWKTSNSLHEYIFVSMALVRVVGVFASLWSRWYQRRRLMHLVNGFRRLMMKKPHVKHAHSEMVKLMEERTLFPRNLDIRLDESKFQLQLVRNPLKFTIMGLFTVQRSNSITIGQSIILHSIFLIQYEIQNY
ncbi:uncharacterized protein Dwil_GK27178 [Drosophila willistoni]|uniref:Gustatory receptor n=1 Tax=Drosophila willistoni TaxID=7260 RepID=A0A0Q9X1J2_DROWI|nr:uncharacterized protein Dwil_GK27178 [Drosophila willistoni]